MRGEIGEVQEHEGLTVEIQKSLGGRRVIESYI